MNREHFLASYCKDAPQRTASSFFYFVNHMHKQKICLHFMPKTTQYVNPMIIYVE